MRRADIIKLLASGPVRMSDSHKAVFYLIHHKHDMPIVSELVSDEEPLRLRPYREPLPPTPAVRVWRLLDGYTPEQVYAARIHGLNLGNLLKQHAPEEKWAGVISAMHDPVLREAAWDVLRGWA